MEGLAPDGFRPKMGRTKASNRRVIDLEARVSRLEQAIKELQKPKRQSTAKKKAEQEE